MFCVKKRVTEKRRSLSTSFPTDMGLPKRQSPHNNANFINTQSASLKIWIKLTLLCAFSKPIRHSSGLYLQSLRLKFQTKLVSFLLNYSHLSWGLFFIGTPVYDFHTIHYCPVFETPVIQRISSHHWNKRKQHLSNHNSWFILGITCPKLPQHYRRDLWITNSAAYSY